MINLTPVFAPHATLARSSSSGSCSTDIQNDGSGPPGKPHPPVNHWLVHLASGAQVKAKKVVIGIGSTNRQRMPQVLQQLQAIDVTDGCTGSYCQTDNTCRRNSSSSSSCSADELATVEAGQAAGEQLQLQHLASCSTTLQQLSITAPADNDCCEMEPNQASCSSSACSSAAADGNEELSSSWGSSSYNPDRSPCSQQADSDCGCDRCCDLVIPASTDAAAPAAATNIKLSTISGQEQQSSTPCATVSLSTDASHVPRSDVADASSCTCDSTNSSSATFIPAAGTYPTGRLLHSWDLAAAVAAAGGSCCSQACSSTGCDPVLQRIGLLYPGESVIIIGGGLTSAHLAQMAAAAGASKTTLLLRSEWRVKQFDVDLPYMGRLRHKKLQEFRQIKSFDQRLALIKQVLQVCTICSLLDITAMRTSTSCCKMICAVITMIDI